LARWDAVSKQSGNQGVFFPLTGRRRAAFGVQAVFQFPGGATDSAFYITSGGGEVILKPGLGMFPCTRRSSTMDGAFAGRKSGGIKNRAEGFHHEHSPSFKKNELKPHLSKYWKIPPDGCAAFVVCMEDVLDVYHTPYDPQFPIVCMDESNKQLVGEVHAPLPPAPGRGQIVDHEYVRNGVAEIFLEVEPLTGRRHVVITDHRTRKDWAHFVKGMLDERYPHATKVRLVMDNLNTHSAASLYETFEPEEARRLARRLEIHYTPKHGSWLNVAEIELSALSIQCLDRRIPDIDLMRKEVAAWEMDRNNRSKIIDWRFTTEDARIKLKRLYPKM
jgi:hypothetical protein